MTLEEPLGMRDTSGNSDMEEDQMESEQDREGGGGDLRPVCESMFKRKSWGGGPGDMLSVSGAG